MKPFFSVVISIYNKEKFIVQTLESVLAQTFTDFEIIIVNDGSTDNSLKLIQNFQDARLTIIDQQNSGASVARNNGMAAAKGVFIALLDGDDIWDPDFLKYIHEATVVHPDKCVFTTALAHLYDGKIIPVTYSFKSDADTLVLDYFKSSQQHTILSGSTAVFKKEILKTTGVFDRQIASGQDTDFWIRIGLHYPIVFINKVLVFYVYNRESLSNTTTNLSLKPKFDKYYDEENTNKYLKLFLDRNRFSLAILSKLNDDTASYNYYRNALSKKNLSLKHQILIDAPKWLLKMLLKIKSASGKKAYHVAS
ncbi:MAG: glycosyltransferase family 2 protein [Algicola sp.]|nr:glycosyltransferase family 2 protein [Algicola sp.]